MTDAVEQGISDMHLHLALAQTLRLLLRRTVCCGDREVALRRSRPTAVDPHDCACRNRTNGLIRCVRLGDTAEKIKANPTRRVRFSRYLAATQERFDL